MLCLGDKLMMNLRKTVDEVVCRGGDPEVLRQIDDLHLFRDGVLFQVSLTLAMTETEEYHIHLIERGVSGEYHVGVSKQSFVHITDGIAGITLTIGKHDVYLGVVEQQSDQFTTGIAGST